MNHYTGDPNDQEAFFTWLHSQHGGGVRADANNSPVERNVPRVDSAAAGDERNAPRFDGDPSDGRAFVEWLHGLHGRAW